MCAVFLQIANNGEMLEDEKLNTISIESEVQPYETDTTSANLTKANTGTHKQSPNQMGGNTKSEAQGMIVQGLYAQLDNTEVRPSSPTWTSKRGLFNSSVSFSQSENSGKITGKIQCSVCEAQYDNITEYTHHLNTHSQDSGLNIDEIEHSEYATPSTHHRENEEFQIQQKILEDPINKSEIKEPPNEPGIKECIIDQECLQESTNEQTIKEESSCKLAINQPQNEPKIKGSPNQEEINESPNPPQTKDESPPDQDSTLQTDAINKESKEKFSFGERHLIDMPNVKKQFNEMHKKQKPFTCTLCDKSFALKETLTVHLKIHHKLKHVKKPLCIWCGRSFVSKGALGRHVDSIHKKLKSFTCTLCDKSFSQKGTLSQHVAVVHQKSFVCTLCDKSFCNKYYLTRHIDIMHKKQFAEKHNMLGHQVKPEKILSCTLCDKSFARKTHLTQHVAGAHDKSFTCTLCHKSFSTKLALTIHMRSHTKQKPFSCSVCQKKFSQKSNLIVHSRSHTKSRPFSCSLCQKDFYTKQNRDVHIVRVHSNLKPFSNTLCDKSFGWKTERSLHINGVDIKQESSANKIEANNVELEPKKPFSCTFCKKSFSTKGYLVRHMDAVHQLKPISCTLCDKSFTFKTNFTRHLKKIPNISKWKPTDGKSGIKTEFAPQQGNDHMIKSGHVTLCHVIRSEPQLLDNIKEDLTKQKQINRPGKPLTSLLSMKQLDTKDTKDVSFYNDESFGRNLEIKKELTSTSGNDRETINLGENSGVQIDKGHQAFIFSGDGKPELNVTTQNATEHFNDNIIKTELFLQDQDVQNTINTQAALSTEKTLSSITVSGFKTEKPIHPFEIASNQGPPDVPTESSPNDYSLPLKDVAAVHDKSFTCTSCDKSFGSKQYLAGHVAAVHDKLKSFSCKLCDKSFASKQSLSLHVTAVHDKLKPFSCTLCEKSFGSKLTMTRHVAAVHNKLKPFTCSVCNKSFAHKGTLTAHLKTHLNPVHRKPKPFSCTLCDKSFSQSGQLSLHMAATHDKSFTCTLCEKLFYSKQYLSEHVAAVHAQCTLCDKAFASKRSLTAHINAIHTLNTMMVKVGSSWSKRY